MLNLTGTILKSGGSGTPYQAKNGYVKNKLNKAFSHFLPTFSKKKIQIQACYLEYPIRH